jgi:hypothetical protein
VPGITCTKACDLTILEGQALQTISRKSISFRALRQHTHSVRIRSRLRHVQDSEPCRFRIPALNIGKMYFLMSEGVVDRCSKADLPELKVAAWAVVTSGLESEVQCIP